MILGIDPGTHCGWCLMWQDGSVCGSGTWNLRESPKDHRGMLFLRLHSAITYLAEDLDNPTIAYERVFRHSSADAKDLYGGFIGVAEMVAAAWDIPVARVPVGTWKKALTGNGNAKPEAYLAAASAKWPGMDLSEDAAAACGIADAARLGLHVTVKKAKKRRKTA